MYLSLLQPCVGYQQAKKHSCYIVNSALMYSEVFKTFVLEVKCLNLVCNLLRVLQFQHVLGCL